MPFNRCGLLVESLSPSLCTVSFNSRGFKVAQDLSNSQEVLVTVLSQASKPCTFNSFFKSLKFICLNISLTNLENSCLG